MNIHCNTIYFAQQINRSTAERVEQHRAREAVLCPWQRVKRGAPALQDAYRGVLRVSARLYKCLLVQRVIPCNCISNILTITK